MKKISEELIKVGTVKVNSTYSTLVDLFGDLECYAFNLKSNRYTPNSVHAFEDTFTSLTECLGCYQLDTIYEVEDRSELTELSVLVSFVTKAIRCYINADDFKEKFSETASKFWVRALDTINNNLLPTIYNTSVYVLKFFKDNMEEFDIYNPIDQDIKEEFLDLYEALMEMVDQEDLDKTPSDIIGFNISEMFKTEEDEEDDSESLPTEFGEY